MQPMERGGLRRVRALLMLASLMLAAACTSNFPAPVVNGGNRLPPPLSGTIRVSQGDTVYGIARRYGVSVRGIIEANALRPPYILRVGDKLALPLGDTHRVVRGDTLSVIAQRYGVAMSELARTNNLGPPYTIYVDQRLRLPYGREPIEKRDNERRDTERREVVITSPNAGRAGPSVGPAPGSLPQQQETTSNTVPTKYPTPSAVPQPPASTGRGFLWPVRGKVLAEFGPAGKGQHNDGINIAVAEGTPVRAAEHGVVAYSGNELRGFGNLLLIKHENGWMTAYGHNQTLLVKRGDTVTRGQVIANAGATGNVTEPQVHFELRKGSKVVDPKAHLSDFMAKLTD